MRKELDKPKVQQVVKNEDDFFDVEEVGEGTEFMATKPWLGQMREPTGWNRADKNADKPPQMQMELEWVHGYRCRDSRNNI